jgi:serine/threonine-protein kinase
MENPAPEREGEFSPGDVCEGYRILSLIAKGGMGDVYEATHEASGRVVALKCLKVKHLRKDDARARMKMEAIVLSELEHANLVQVYDAGVNDLGMVWIAMERLHGQTLRQLLHRVVRLSIPEALYYASEIAEGVDAVHEVNVIHRDLKPENVFITRRNDVKVLDLGTGKFAGYGVNNTDRMKVVGTTAYMSPEQIKGLRIDPRADVYALGLMVYEMIAGRHPLAREGSAGLRGSPEQIALLQLEAVPAKLSDVAAHCPGSVVRIVHQAIAKDREQRHPTMAAFGRELRAARKRFIAERGGGDSLGGKWIKGERLRDKLGASPLPSSRPGASLREAGPTHVPTGNEASDDLQLGNTILDPFPPMAPGSSGHEPTVEFSASSPSAPPAAVQGGAEAAAARDEIRNRTTNTNPLGLARPAELTPEPHSFPDLRRPAPLLSRAGIRRVVLTLGLGALIGVPPAVVGVLWRAHRYPLAPSSTPAATPAPRDIAPAEVSATAPPPDLRPVFLTAPLDRAAEPTGASSALVLPLTNQGGGHARDPRPWRAAPRLGSALPGGSNRASKPAAPVLEEPNFPSPSAASSVSLPPSGL